MTQSLPPTLMFLVFVAASFAVLRAVLTNFAKDNRAAYAAPALIIFGVVSAFIFNRLALHQFFIWHLLIFTLIIFSWHAKSRSRRQASWSRCVARRQKRSQSRAGLRVDAPAAGLRPRLVYLRVRRGLLLSVHTAAA